MTQKIDGQSFRPVDSAGTRRAEAAKPPGDTTASSTAAGSVGSGDTVNLTSSGMLLSKLQDTLQSVPIVDPARVQAIKDALASGRHQIDSQAVADKMIRFDRELLV